MGNRRRAEMLLATVALYSPSGWPTRVRPAWAWTYGVWVSCTWILSVRISPAQVLAQGKGGTVRGRPVWTRMPGVKPRENIFRLVPC